LIFCFFDWAKVDEMLQNNSAAIKKCFIKLFSSSNIVFQISRS